MTRSTGPGSGCSRFRATRVLGKRPHSERVSGLCEGDLTRAMIAATVCTEPMQFLAWGNSADAAPKITLSLPLGLLLALPFDLPIAYSGCRGDGCRGAPRELRRVIDSIGSTKGPVNPTPAYRQGISMGLRDRAIRDEVAAAFRSDRRADSPYPKWSRYSVHRPSPAPAFCANGRQTRR
jgi:hypothetical protein